MSLVVAKEIIRYLRSTGVKVRLKNEMASFSTLEGVSQETKVKIAKLGVFIVTVLREERPKTVSKEKPINTEEL
jgi:hypothetical protein